MVFVICPLQPSKPEQTTFKVLQEDSEEQQETVTEVRQNLHQFMELAIEISRRVFGC
jgi:hypothetical protein